MEVLEPFVSAFAEATGVSTGGMDVVWPQDNLNEVPMVLEVSPIFDANPPTPDGWAGPYSAFKDDPQYALRRSEQYAHIAEQIVRAALVERLGRVLVVDVDNTVSDAIPRLRRWTLPSWPGQKLDSRAFAGVELMKDPVIPGAVDGTRSLAQAWDIRYLSAREEPDATAAWLRAQGLPFSTLFLCPTAQNKLQWMREVGLLVEQERQELAKASPPLYVSRPALVWPAVPTQVLIIDDFTRAHHTAQTEFQVDLITGLQAYQLNFEIFKLGDWSRLEKMYTKPSGLR